MIDCHDSYLVGSLILGTAWAVCHVVGKRYRVQMIWGSVVAAPFAITSTLFVPQYWPPPSMFATPFGGIWSGAYEYLQGYRLTSIRPVWLVRTSASSVNG
jgi:hypothetical protein